MPRSRRLQTRTTRQRISSIAPRSAVPTGQLITKIEFSPQGGARGHKTNDESEHNWHKGRPIHRQCNRYRDARAVDRMSEHSGASLRFCSARAFTHNQSAQAQLLQ